MKAVVVQFYKNPDLLHWGFAGYLLGQDEYGHWVGLPRGANRWKGEHPQPPYSEDAVQCFPHDGWWTLHYNGPGQPVTHFVDITTQPVFTGGRFEMIDLDLDLLVTAEGSVLIEDEDEFALHQVALGYSPGMISRASSELREIEALLRTRAEPFFEVAADWLEVASRQLSGRGPV